MPVQHILQTMLDDENRFFVVFVDLIDQIDGRHAHGRIQRGKRLVEQQCLDVLVVHDPGKRNLLLLPAGEAIGDRLQKTVHIHNFGSRVNLLQHLRTGNRIIFQRKGNIFTNRQPDKLGIRIL